MDPFSIALLLLVAAIVLAFVDVFIPSGGMLLVLAVAAGFASVLFGFRSSNTAGMAMLTAVVVAVPILFYVLLKIWPLTPIGRRVILKTPSTELSSEQRKSHAGLEGFVGSVIQTEYDLLPSGQIKIGHRFINAISESSMIERGARVKIIAVRGSSLVVRETNEQPTPINGLDETSVGEHEPEMHPEVEHTRGLLELSADELGLDSIDDDQLDRNLDTDIDLDSDSKLDSDSGSNPDPDVRN